MSQTLKLEISSSVFSAMALQAEARGIEMEQLVATLLEREFLQQPSVPVPEDRKEDARLRFERHFGTLAVEGTGNIDNASIDEDLAKEYASGLE